MGKHIESAKLRKAQTKELFKACPEVIGAFGKLHHVSIIDGALSGKTKELISLAIGISSRCDGCINAHIEGAIKHGATKEEISEAIAATIYGGIAVEVMNEFFDGLDK